MISIKQCRGCGDTRLTQVLDLGNLAVIRFKESIMEKDDYAPLNLVKCSNCNLVQLNNTVSPERLFSQFHYLSGINQSMNDSLFDIVKHVESIVDLKPGDICCDIGSNDGTLLSYYRKCVRSVGFEPARNVHLNSTHTLEIKDYFSAARFHESFHEQDKAKVITAVAMFYDIEDPNSFLKDVYNILDNNGIFLSQQNDLDYMIDNISVDNICHEHLCYYNMDSLLSILKKNGLYPIHVSYNNVNGGSIRVVCNKTPNDKKFKGYPLTGRGLPGMWECFLKEKKKLLTYIENEKKKDHVVWGYGASTRGNTLLQLLDLDDEDIIAIVDRNPKKWGKYTTGGNIPIVSEDHLRGMTFQPENLLVLPYYFKDEFLKREIEYLKRGGRMIFPLPKLKIYTWDKDNEKVIVHY